MAKVKTMTLRVQDKALFGMKGSNQAKLEKLLPDGWEVINTKGETGFLGASTGWATYLLKKER